jgi:uncharacterized Zn finger protein
MLHRAALARIGWAPDKLASHLLELSLNDPWDTFSRVLDEYGEVLGDDGRAAFFSHARSRLDALPALPFGADFDEKYPYLQLTGILADQARAADDREALIELDRRTCTDALDCYRIASQYLDLEDSDRASEWLDKGDAAAQDRTRDYALRVAVHCARKEWGKATEAQREEFTRSPHIGQYRRLEELAARAGRGEQTKEDAIHYLRSGLSKDRWHASTCALTLAAILYADGVAAEAAALVDAHARNAEDLIQAAGWFGEHDPGQACKFVLRAVEGHIERKSNASYRRAVDLLIEKRALFDRAGEARFKEVVDELRQRHKAKRNLQALLNEATAAPRGDLPSGP